MVLHWVHIKINRNACDKTRQDNKQDKGCECSELPLKSCCLWLYGTQSSDRRLKRDCERSEFVSKEKLSTHANAL